jgi:hypothetical protein
VWCFWLRLKTGFQRHNFNDLKARISTARQNAKDNQHTNVNELVEYLQNIKILEN